MSVGYVAMVSRALGVALASVLLVPATVGACALFSPAARDVRVQGEEVLIVWDAANRREHLVRHIGFEGSAENFGFVVPTPSEPEVAEVRGRPFDGLYRLYRRPERRSRSRSSAPSMRASSMSSLAAPVEVVARHHVAGQTATVLRASDAAALDRWLATHGYPSGAALARYLGPYVERGWYLTAFRYDKAQRRRALSPALRLSFDTERPFFPYAEPHRRTRARPFRLSVVAAQPMNGLLENLRGEGARRWSARVGYRAPLRAVDARGILGAAGITPPAGSLHLTVFDEPASRRGTRDLFFVEAPGAPDVAPRLRTRIVPPRRGRRAPAGNDELQVPEFQ